jgi:hypothetical protein
MSKPMFIGGLALIFVMGIIIYYLLTGVIMKKKTKHNRVFVLAIMGWLAFLMAVSVVGIGEP